MNQALRPRHTVQQLLEILYTVVAIGVSPLKVAEVESNLVLLYILSLYMKFPCEQDFDFDLT